MTGGGTACRDSRIEALTFHASNGHSDALLHFVWMEREYYIPKIHTLKEHCVLSLKTNPFAEVEVSAASSCELKLPLIYPIIASCPKKSKCGCNHRRGLATRLVARRVKYQRASLVADAGSIGRSLKVPIEAQKEGRSPVEANRDRRCSP